MESGCALLYQGLSPRVRGNPIGYNIGILIQGSIPACAGEPKDAAPRPELPEVYPRVCGGTLLASRKLLSTRGLSPRVRGNPNTWYKPFRVPRSIPACAGEPGASNPPAPLRRVYPRVCGGTPPSSASISVARGLSPRVRGNLVRLAKSAGWMGSIPACAGEPAASSGSSSCRAVYPRVCGGTSSRYDDHPAFFGLSPRVRGNLAPPRPASTAGRSIPACAGEPHPFGDRPALEKVYPRVCGGTHELCNFSARQDGLSPRVRGNLAGAIGNPRRVGSIPACAGEPALTPAPPGNTGVYPRVCGGTLIFYLTATPGDRSIPACAGEPGQWAADSTSGRVYPRVCGGTRKTGEIPAGYRGLSPRVRGNRWRGAGSAGTKRSIPACAGEPRPATSSAPAPWVYPRVCGGTRRTRWSGGRGRGLSPRVRGNL